MASDPPKVFISYSHDSLEHSRRVLGLAERLRKDGIDAQIDRYVNGTPAEGWPRWMDTQLEWADFVLLLCTETYYRRFRGQEQPEKGRGVDWEGALVTNEIYQDKSLTTKFVPVFLSSSEVKFIRRPLLGHTHYILETEENYSELLAFFVGRAGVLPGPLGPLNEISQIEVEPLRFDQSGSGKPLELWRISPGLDFSGTLARIDEIWGRTSGKDRSVYPGRFSASLGRS